MSILKETLCHHPDPFSSLYFIWRQRQQNDTKTFTILFREKMYVLVLHLFSYSVKVAICFIDDVVDDQITYW